MSTKNKEFPTCSSSAGVKSFLMLKVFLISSGVLPAQFKFHSLSKLGKQELTLDHVGNSLAGDIQKSLINKYNVHSTLFLMKGREGCFVYLDIKVVGGQDELEESPLIHLNNSIMYKNNLFFHYMYVRPSLDSRTPDTLRKSASHVEISSVLFSLFSSSSGGGGSSW